MDHNGSVKLRRSQSVSPQMQGASINIEFKDITYSVSMGRKKGKKDILKGVSGKFQLGELTAIMGPSGAGKSSLLNVLTGFQSSGIKGSINSDSSISNNILDISSYKKECCYILQDDRLTPLFSVLETMKIAADLKLGKSLSNKAKYFLIEDILDTLLLSEHKETRCELLSGGQRKRLSVALELIGNPTVMFLDEPTTGLDSSSSAQCIRILKDLAKGGRTIICTIHQPTASLYEMFDHVYVLAQGECIYQGASNNTIPYLSSVGLHCPQFYNSADYLIEVANGDYGDFVKDLSMVATTTAGTWRKGEEIKSENNTYINGYSNEKSVMKLEPKNGVKIQKPSEWHKFKILLNRSLVIHYRDWTITYVKLVLHLLVGIILGLMYLNFGNDGSQAFRNVGYVLISNVYLCYTSMMPAVLRFPDVLPILKKERFNNWYGLKTCYIASIVLDVPIQILFCFVYTSVSYVMTGQPLDLFRYVMFLIALVLITLTSESLGILLGTLVNPVNGTFFGAIFTAVLLVLGGFLILLDHMPLVFRWASQLSFLRHGVQAIAIALYGYNRENLNCPEDVDYCHYRSPIALLTEFSMENTNYWFNCTMLVGFFVTFRLAAYISLRHRLRTQ